MTAKTMAEVLIVAAIRNDIVLFENDVEALTAALSAAGFGLVADAKAEALLTMADRLEKARDMTWNGSMRKVNGWASAADFLRQYSEQAGNRS